MRSTILSVAMASLLLLGGACSRQAPPEPAQPAGVAIPGLGLELATLPGGLVVDSVSDDSLVLVPSDAAIEGRLRIAAAPAELGTNLQEAVRAHRQEIEAHPGGTYLGAQELVGPLGTAYWSRGRYSVDGTTVEEAAAFTLDPTRSRIVRVTYVYPADGDSAERVQTLLDVLGELQEPGSPQAAE